MNALHFSLFVSEKQMLCIGFYLWKQQQQKEQEQKERELRKEKRIRRNNKKRMGCKQSKHQRNATINHHATMISEDQESSFDLHPNSLIKKHQQQTQQNYGSPNIISSDGRKGSSGGVDESMGFKLLDSCDYHYRDSFQGNTEQQHKGNIDRNGDNITDDDTSFEEDNASSCYNLSPIHSDHQIRKTLKRDNTKTEKNNVLEHPNEYEYSLSDTNNNEEKDALMEILNKPSLLTESDWMQITQLLELREESSLESFDRPKQTTATTTALHVSCKRVFSSTMNAYHNNNSHSSSIIVNAIQALIRKYPQDVFQQDPNRNIPIHYLLTTPIDITTSAFSTSDNKTRTKTKEVILEIMTQIVDLILSKVTTTTSSLQQQANKEIIQEYFSRNDILPWKCSCLYRILQIHFQEGEEKMDGNCNDQQVYKIMYNLLKNQLFPFMPSSSSHHYDYHNAETKDTPLNLLYRRSIRHMYEQDKFFQGDNSRREIVQHRQKYKIAHEQTWKLIKLILLHMSGTSEATTEDNDSISSSSILLHAAVQMECPPQLVLDLLHRADAAANKKNSTSTTKNYHVLHNIMGELPIHKAAASIPNYTSLYYPKFLMDTLISHFPSTTRIPTNIVTSNGGETDHEEVEEQDEKYPLQIAMEAGAIHFVKKHNRGQENNIMNDEHDEAEYEQVIDRLTVLRNCSNIGVKTLYASFPKAFDIMFENMLSSNNIDGHFTQQQPESQSSYDDDDLYSEATSNTSIPFSNTSNLMVSSPISSLAKSSPVSAGRIPQTNTNTNQQILVYDTTTYRELRRILQGEDSQLSFFEQQEQEDQQHLQQHSHSYNKDYSKTSTVIFNIQKPNARPQDVISSMWAYPTDAAIQMLSCVTLVNLINNSRNENNQNYKKKENMVALQICVAGGIEAVVNAMKNLPLEAVIQQKAFEVLTLLADVSETNHYDKNKSYSNRLEIPIVSSGCIELIIKAMTRFSKDPIIQKEGCICLCSIIQSKLASSTTSAMRTIEQNQDIGSTIKLLASVKGFEVLINAIENFLHANRNTSSSGILDSVSDVGTHIGHDEKEDNLNDMVVKEACRTLHIFLQADLLSQEEEGNKDGDNKSSTMKLIVDDENHNQINLLLLFQEVKRKYPNDCKYIAETIMDILAC